MNAQDYIESGLLEAFVLGGLGLAESEQVAGAMCRFAEVAAEVARLEAVVLRVGETEAVAPPAGLDDKIWAAIQANGPAETAPTVAAIPAMETQRNLPLPQRRSISISSWAQAAMIALLLGSVVAIVMLANSRKETQTSLIALQQKLDNMRTQQQLLAAHVERYRDEADMMASPDMTPVPMRSMLPGHPMAATLYWNKEKQTAYVSVKKLPMPPAGMQYQLWAIEGGKPVDIGMLRNDVVADAGMQQVPKAVSGGQAFAVSLEKEGGSNAPTPDRIYLMGKMPG